MRILLAPDSFKGAQSAAKVCLAMEQGIRVVLADAFVDSVPLADGGEGTVDCLLGALGGQRIPVQVTDLLGEPHVACYGLLPDGTAVIEVAAVVSRDVLGARAPDVLHAHSFGVGQLIAHALDHGARDLLIGLGGSATNDAGVGLLHALGVRLLDRDGRALSPTPLSCAQLARLDCTGMHPGLAQARIRVACDVSNPLIGPQGATAVYGPQKGVSVAQMPLLEQTLANFARVVEVSCGTSIADTPGAGAAGGIGGALAGVFGASLHSGIDLLLDACRFAERLETADLVLTGEGQTDHQTASGKVVAGVARRAAAKSVPVVCLSGSVTAAATCLYQEGVTALFSIAQGTATLEEAMAKTYDHLVMTTQQVVRLFVAGARL